MGEDDRKGSGAKCPESCQALGMFLCRAKGSSELH